jgi:hypothetical protein
MKFGGCKPPLLEISVSKKKPGSNLDPGFLKFYPAGAV